MSFSEAFREVFFRACLQSFLFAIFAWLFATYSGDEELSAMAFGIAFFVFVVGVFICGSILATKDYCPKCKKYLCFKEYEREVLSRDVLQKYERDSKGYTQIAHYAVGKRKHYYKCNSCGHESTSIKDYKEKIDV